MPKFSRGDWGSYASGTTTGVTTTTWYTLVGDSTGTGMTTPATLIYTANGIYTDAMRSAYFGHPIPQPPYQQPPPPPLPPRPPPASGVTVDSAWDRATRLLLAHLTPEQRGQYDHDHSFIVNVKGRRYQVKEGWSGNVKRLNDAGAVAESFCIHFGEMIPIPDLMLAQKLMLETDEAEFRRIANVTVRA